MKHIQTHAYLMTPQRQRGPVFKPAILCAALTALASHSAVWGQAAAATSDADIERQRQATQSMVEQVTADQDKPTDRASSLGQALPAALQSKFKPWKEAVRAKAPVDTADKARLELPVLAKPEPAVVLRRPVDTSPKSNLSTPDFSRQSLTFAQLTGKSEIDLPEPEGGLGTSVVTRKTTEFQQVAFSMPDLLQAGLEFSPELNAVRARQESSRQRVSKSRADLLPSFSARYATGKENSTTTTLNNSGHDYKNTSLRVTQPLVNYPAWETWQASGLAMDAALLRSSAMEQDVSLNLVKAVINLTTSRITLNFSDELLDNLSGILSYQDQRSQSGASSQAELERARSRVLAARQARLEQQANYKGGLLELERQLGFAPQLLNLPFLSQLPSLPRTQAEIRDLVLKENAELTALRAEVEAQKAQVRAQYGRAAPTVLASLEDDRATNNGGVMGSRQDTRALVVLNWAVSLGGKEYFAGKEASADLSELQSKLEQNEQRLAQAVDTDFALLQAATLRISLGQQEQEAARRVTEAVREQLKVGRISSLLEALDASQSLYDARLKLTQALGQQMLAQAQLLKSMGRLSTMREQARIQLK
ncbi:TolC family protein [Limnohabitans sp. T6-5]|uniref:TolC family protein n=1 Tax=Limnohabitans sp. T6-5 TaxID=1100724 RepID=UPI0011B21940|nr:TolC family protein [Limnohabitans sp. T6-5]